VAERKILTWMAQETSLILSSLGEDFVNTVMNIRIP
jgi:hypothetical protein